MEKHVSAKGKIQEICDILKQETIEPAKQEAAEIVENARMQAEEIINDAKKNAQELLEKAKQTREQEKRTFDASLNLACKQTVDTLKQSIEKELFQSALKELLDAPMKEPKLLAQLINSIAGAIDKEGIDVDLSAFISKEVSAKAINELLLQKIGERLREKAVEVGDFEGGVKLKLHERDITIDMSMDSLKDLLASFVRKEFREMIFKA